MATRQSKRGFTLIELVTVIAILGIVSIAVGGPTLAFLDGIRSSSAAARLASDIRYVQRLALNCGQRTWVVFNAGADQYALYIEDPANPGKANRTALPHPLDQTTAPVQFGVGPFANVTINTVNINGTAELEFDSFGVPYDANGSALSAAAAINLSSGITLTVHPVSGAVEVSG